MGPADDSTTTATLTAYTPSECSADDNDNDNNDIITTTPPSTNSSSIPRPNATFIISARPAGPASPKRILTLLDGQVVLAPPGGRGCIHWRCDERGGWYGFRNVTSGAFLGHDNKGPGRLCCRATALKEWERFTVRPRADGGGGYDLLMVCWWVLAPVGVRLDGGGVEVLERVPNGEDSGVSWEFTEV